MSPEVQAEFSHIVAQFKNINPNNIGPEFRAVIIALAELRVQTGNTTK